MTAVKRVVCLHGYAMDSHWLRDWLVPVEQALSGRVEFIYPQAPIELTKADVLSVTRRFQAVVPDERIGAGRNWCWYRATDNKPPQYTGLEETLSSLRILFQEHGPISGVLGWSQGAVLAAILAGLMKRDPNSGFKFDWSLLCGGFLPGEPSYRALFGQPIIMPSLHVIGRKESEFMLQQGSRLFAAFHNAERLDTPVGHVLPIKYPKYMLKIANWIDQQCR